MNFHGHLVLVNSSEHFLMVRLGLGLVRFGLLLNNHATLFIIFKTVSTKIHKKMSSKNNQKMSPKIAQKVKYSCQFQQIEK